MDKENQLVEVPQQLNVANFNPKQELERGIEAAKALMSVLKPIQIQGNKYFQFEHWQTLARFFNCTVGVDWSKRLLADDGKFVGYEARAIVYNAEGRVISAAEASCTIAEKNWSERDNFQIRSMAQTRACAKALRNVFAWVAVLGGVKPTPAEEMYDDPAKPPFESKPRQQEDPLQDIITTGAPICEYQDCAIEVNEAVEIYSRKKFNGKIYCYPHQRTVAGLNQTK